MSLKDGLTVLSSFILKISPTLAEEVAEIGRMPDLATLRERLLARKESDRTIIFIDDCILTGTQAIHIFSELLGIWRKQPYKYHDIPLALGQIDNLRAGRIAVIAGIGTNLATLRLSRFFDEQAIEHDIIFGQTVPWLSEDGMRDSMAGRLLGEDDAVREPRRQLADPIFSPGSRFPVRGDWEVALHLCKEIGFELLADRAAALGWSAKWQEGSALGFSGMQGRLVFAHNVPKTMLTLLWCSGFVQGRQWVPLFPARD